MIRNIIEINEEKCNACGLCVNACKEGAVSVENGKARLIRDDYCDGLGNCLPVCPSGAITVIAREAPDFNAEEAAESMKRKEKKTKLPEACSGTASERTVSAGGASQLRQWPVQIRLVPVRAPYFENAHLLIAADCSAYAYGNFHADFMRDRVVLIGCPKLDAQDYAEKLADILKTNAVEELTVIRMAVPCCAGIVNAAKAAVKACGKALSLRTVMLSPEGTILQDSR
jgi:ferredoxin